MLGLAMMIGGLGVLLGAGVGFYAAARRGRADQATAWSEGYADGYRDCELGVGDGAIPTIPAAPNPYRRDEGTRRDRI